MKDTFSFTACRFIHSWYEDLSEETGEPIEFDRVLFRSHWNEYETIDEAWEDWPELGDPGSDAEYYTLEDGRVLVYVP